ncbi:hypothetical protein Cni_G23195 [Canna indica]|uniref:Uncharacterized protein n=1 Tax=Canna indica TaxID=4628 RepID=A0AAQ3QND0_9LILI|nr:hypothetical protein Cni_G23195 [Canna indica]
MNRRQIPAFGNWDYCDDLPITQYFESAMQAGLVRDRFLGNPQDHDADLFRVDDHNTNEKPPYHQHIRKAKKGGQKQYQLREGQERTKQGKVCDVTAQAATPRRPRAPKAVDEDLYKIPPELLYKKPKRCLQVDEGEKMAGKRVV